MFKKYHLLNDNELVFQYKNTHQDDLEYELISRYQKNAKLLAGVLFSKFKFLYQVEYDDIYCILLGSLFSAIKGFNDDNIDFYQYWKSTATHDALVYINHFKQSQNELVLNTPNSSDEPSLVGYLKDKSTQLKDDYLFSFELDELLTNPRNRLTQEDADIFRLYLAGYSMPEISNMTSMPYNKVRYRIGIVKRKISNILFNQ